MGFNVKIDEGLNLSSKKTYREEIRGNYPNGSGRLIQYWESGQKKYVHQTYNNGSWYKFWYDKNTNPEFFQRSDGYWMKREYNEHGELIYAKDSHGLILDKRPQNINEGLNLVSKKKYREEIVGNYPNGYGSLTQYWDNGNGKFMHRTYDNGTWSKFTYDENENLIYYEDSDGYWSKREYDENGNEIYYGNSNGVIRDNRPQNINESPLHIKNLLREQIKQNKHEIKKSLINKHKINEDLIDAVFEQHESLIAETLLSTLKIETINDLLTENPFKCSINDVEKKAKKIIFVKYNWDPKNVLFETENDAVQITASNDFRTELQTMHDDVIFDYISSIARKYEKDLNDEFSNFCTKITFLNSYSTHITSSVYCYTIVKRPDGIFIFNSNGEKKKIKHGNHPQYTLNKLYFKIGLFASNVKTEGLNLVSKKKYREEIVDNYPNGYGSLTQYWDNGNRKFIHRTYDNGTWSKSTYDENENLIYYEYSDGYWEKHEYDVNGNEIYYEDSEGYWYKTEYNKDGYKIYFENSNGVIEDNRPQNINEGLNLPKMTPQSWFKLILNKTTQHTSPDYPDSIFFKLYNDLIFEYNKETQYFWIDYYNIWSVFETKFNLNYNQIKELTKGMVEEHYKLGPVTTITV